MNQLIWVIIAHYRYVLPFLTLHLVSLQTQFVEKDEFRIRRMKSMQIMRRMIRMREISRG